MLKGAWPFAKILVDINKFPPLSFSENAKKTPPLFFFDITTNKKLRE